MTGAATEVAGASGGVVVMTVLPRVIAPTAGWVNVVFMGALPDPARGISRVVAAGGVVEKLRTPSVITAEAPIIAANGFAYFA
jgi:hypothetical protein